MFPIFLALVLVLENMFLSSFIVGFEKPSFETSYNASTIRDTFAILVANTCLFQGVVVKNYFCISFGRTLLILSV
jgi:hypothetical protein